MQFDSAASLRLIAESLGLIDRLGAQPIRVRVVQMVDRTLVVEVTVDSDDPMTVRGEIANVMGAVSGLDVPSLFPVLGVQSIGVRAFGAADEELLWIMSSIEAAGFIAKGQPIEWLSRSLIQENTPAYRRSQADRRIGQIETSLRDLIDEHANASTGDSYVDQLWGPSQLAEMRDQAKAEGRDPTDPRTILEYAYLPQLRDAVVEHADWFDDDCVTDFVGFRESMTRLNKVRRKVAHNRPIAEEDLRASNEVADLILGPLGRAHPELAEDLVVDRWDERAAEIVGEAQQMIQSPTVPGVGEVSEVERRTAAVHGLELQLAGIVQALDSFGQLVIPSHRSQLHASMVSALVRWRAALQSLVAVAQRRDLSLAQAEAAQAGYSAALGEVRELSKEIQRLRVGPIPDPTP
jgi:hypothetical protein